MTALTDLLACVVPLQQAPMGGGVSTPELAVAVSRAGGIGSIAALGMSADQLDGALADIQDIGVLCVNFPTAQVDVHAVEAASGRVDLVDFFWNDPDPQLVKVAHSGGAQVCWQVGSLAEAKAAQDAGCDIIAVQGVEAGGHVRGSDRLSTLLRSVLSEVSVPVIAAGGMADSESVGRALESGAAGVRVGTRFVASDESGAHPLYKQAIVNASAGATEITAEFATWCPFCATQATTRVLSCSVNAMRSLPDGEVARAYIGGAQVAVPRGAGLPPCTGTFGHVEAMPMYAGESAALVSQVLPAAKIVAELFG